MQNSDDNLDQAPVQDSFTTLVNEDHAARIDKLVDDYKTHILTQLNAQNSRETTFSDRLADKFALFAGSWKFILIFTTFLTVWMAWNTLSLTKAAHFDVAPFILLNLILSFTAAFQAPFIIMSQNRQAIRDKHEAVVDFSINYKAELELDDMQGHLHRLELQIAEITKCSISFIVNHLSNRTWDHYSHSWIYHI